MSLFNIMAEIEQQQYQIDLACAVLAEAEAYFESKEDFRYLPHYADRIMKLLYVATNILHNTKPELGKAANALMDKYKEEQYGKDD